MLELNHFYNMDCMEGMKQFPDKYFELAIVDPPYGGNDAIGVKNGKSHAANRKDYDSFDNVAPKQDYFDELKRVSKNQIVWGGNYFGLKGGVIVWNKNGTAFGDGEIAICSTHNSVRIFEYTWNGMLQENMKNKEYRIHSNQKPIPLYIWQLKNYAKQGYKILDTHVGSASSLIACYQMGFDYIGFEKDKIIFDKANERLENAKAQTSMLDLI